MRIYKISKKIDRSIISNLIIAITGVLVLYFKPGSIPYLNETIGSLMIVFGVVKIIAKLYKNKI